MMNKSLTDRIRTVLINANDVNSILHDTLFGFSPIERIRITVRDVEGVEDVVAEITPNFTVLTIRHAFDVNWDDVYPKISIAISRLY